jgi:hypothetical protein
MNYLQDNFYSRHKIDHKNNNKNLSLKERHFI